LYASVREKFAAAEPALFRKMLPEIEPVDPPLPILSVPPLIVIRPVPVPEETPELVRARMPLLITVPPVSVIGPRERQRASTINGNPAISSNASGVAVGICPGEVPPAAEFAPVNRMFAEIEPVDP